MSGRAAALLAYLRRIPGVLAIVFSNRELRRVLLAFAGFNATEWGTWLAMIVFAYGEGGATTAGVVAFVQLLPAAALAPIGSVLGDRHRPGRVLALGYLVQAVTVLATAAVMLADLDPLAVYAVGTTAAIAMTLTRPFQAALVPALARSPAELTAANVASGWVESVTVLVAPVVTGVLLGVSGPGLAWLVLGCVSLVSLALVLPVAGPPPAGLDEHRPGALSELIEGIHLLRREPDQRALVALLSVEAVGLGALDVLYAQLALGALAAGESWAGYLNAAFGAGGAIGIAVTVSLVGRRHLLGPLVVALGGWALALIVLAAVSTRISALLLLALAGVSRAVVDVAGRTLLQRAAPGNLLARIFGLLEGLSMAGLALGSLLVPLLVALGGTTAALVGVAAILPLFAAAMWRRLRTIDRTADVPVVELGLLRALPLFASLSPPTLEQVARSLEPLEVVVGDRVVVQGEHGDRWYAIADGSFEVRRGDEVLAVLTRGQSFGEIALLRGVTRTATVTALTDGALYVLEKDDFVDAVTGHPRSVEAADLQMEQRIATHR